MKRLSDVRSYLAIEGLFPLILCELLLSGGIGLWSQLLSIYLKAIGFTVISIGLRSTVQGVFSALSMMPAGLISDRIGRRRLLILSYVLTLVHVSSLIFFHDFYIILVTTALYGASMGIRGTVVSAYAADHVSSERRGMAFASISLFQIFARIVATTAGSFLANTFGFVSSFQTSFIIVLVTVLLSAYLLRESLKTAKADDRGGRRPSLFESTLNAFKLLKDRNMALLLTGVTIHQLGMRSVFPFLSLYANTVLGFSLVVVGFLMNARQIGDVVGHLPVGKLIERFGGEFTLFLHVCITAPIIYFYSLTDNLVLVFIIFFIWGSEAGWDLPSRRLLIIKFSKGVGTATALGSIQTFIGLTALIAPTLGGWLWDTFSPSSVFQVSAIFNVFACIPLVILLLKARTRAE